MADATKVTVSKPKTGGAIYRAPLGTSLPTDASSELDVAFKELGYASEDGLDQQQFAREQQHQGLGRRYSTTHTRAARKTRFKFTLIEALNIRGPEGRIRRFECYRDAGDRHHGQSQ